jgi:hypothetical protein
MRAIRMICWKAVLQACDSLPRTPRIFSGRIRNGRSSPLFAISFEAFQQILTVALHRQGCHSEHSVVALLRTRKALVPGIRRRLGEAMEQDASKRVEQRELRLLRVRKSSNFASNPIQRSRDLFLYGRCRLPAPIQFVLDCGPDKRG